MEKFSNTFVQRNIINEVFSFFFWQEAAIPIAWSKERYGEGLNFTLNDTCLGLSENLYYRVAYSKYTIPANSGTYSAIFEVKNSKNNGVFIGVALAQKMKTLDQKYFEKSTW